MGKSTVNSPDDRLRSDLRLLVHFLNSDIEAVTAPEANHTVAYRQFDLFLAITSSMNATHDALKRIQIGLRTDLLRVLMSPDPLNQLRGLVEKIDGMRLRTERHVLPISELKPAMKLSSTVEIRKQQFAIVEYEAGDKGESGFYRILDDALKTRIFSEIRNCPNCEKFFLLNDPRMEYCSPTCRKRARTKRKTEAGYYAQKMRESRQRDKAKKRKAAAAERRQNVETYYEKLLRAQELDRVGKLLAIYKKLGGAQEGRRLLSGLKQTPWKQVRPEIRKKILELSKEHPINF